MQRTSILKGTKSGFDFPISFSFCPPRVHATLQYYFNSTSSGNVQRNNGLIDKNTNENKTLQQDVNGRHILMLIDD